MTDYVKVRSLPYRADIDGLRGVAVLLVLVFHFELFELGKGGFIGVDIFFVISGYLISKIIWKALDNQTFKISEFYVRRIKRLAPPLIVTIVLTFAVAMFVMMPAELESITEEAIATQLYLSNIYYWKSINYFGLHAEGAMFLHTWSLAVEEQFYLAYPIFLVALHRWLPGHRSIPLLIAILFSFALNVLFVENSPGSAFYLLPTRAWELLAGGLLAATEHRISVGRLRILLLALGCSLIIWALLAYTPGVPFPGIFALLPVSSAALLILAGVDGAPHRILAWPPLNAIGRISYSLYLVHWPIKVMLPLFFLEVSMSVRWSGFLLALVLAGVMYRTIERPLHDGKFYLKAPVRVYAAATVVLLAALSSILVFSGFPGRFSQRTLALAEATFDYEPATSACEIGRAQRVSACKLGAPDAKQTWLILGDSHARALAPAFDLWLQKRNEAGLLVYKPGCMPVARLGGSKCGSFADEARPYWQAETVQNVFLVSTWRQVLSDDLMDFRNRNVTGTDAVTLFGEGIRETIDKISNNSRQVYVWSPLPTAKKSIPLALARSSVWNTDWRLGQTRAEYYEEYGFFRDAIKPAMGKISKVIEPEKFMCNTGICDTVYKDRPLYTDAGHAAKSQANYFEKILNDQVGN